MLAKIRLHKSGIGQFLPRSVDLLRFSEDDIRQRLVELGHSYDEALLVVGFEDWEIDRSMSLPEAYQLKQIVESVYDGDEFVICHLLGNHQISLSEILKGSNYQFLSKDEEEAMVIISREYDSETLMKMFFRANNWVSLIVAFISAGELLNTSKGFYKKVS